MNRDEQFFKVKKALTTDYKLDNPDDRLVFARWENVYGNWSLVVSVDKIEVVLFYDYDWENSRGLFIERTIYIDKLPEAFDSVCQIVLTAVKDSISAICAEYNATQKAPF